MTSPEIPPANLALVERMAQAIRDELGEEIDAYPGASSPEQADPLNRVFRTLVRSLLETDSVPNPYLPTLVSQSLRRLAERRLAQEGWDDDQARTLIEQEPGSPDDWLAFLLLSSRAQIEPLFAADQDEET